MLPDGTGVHVVRGRLCNRLLLYVAPREPIQERCESGAARVRHFQHHEARRVASDYILIILRRLLDLLDRGARGSPSAGFVEAYGAHD